MKRRGDIPFAASSHDRASARRRDDTWLAEALATPSTRVIAVRSEAQLLAAGDRLTSLGVDEDLAGRQLTFIGIDRTGGAVFVSDVDELGVGRPLPADARFDELRALASVLPADEAAIAAQAVAMVGWHRRHRYCGLCGSLTEVEEAGNSRRCPKCQALHFPRTDPAVIMLVTAGEHCVLSRRRGSRSGYWTALSGFVEPGETPEAAVAREVYEEVGLETTEVVYRASQPWPFPASLMLAFDAEATYEELRVDEELEDARWFARDELLEGVAAGTIHLPPGLSVSHFLISTWLEAQG